MNHHLFELINAGPEASPWGLVLAVLLAKYVVDAILPCVLVGALALDDDGRRDLLQLVVSVLIATLIARVIHNVWPEPRPIALDMGIQHLVHSASPGLPSNHTTLMASIAFATFGTRRLAAWGFPLLTLALLVGLSRVYLGIHFPMDVLAAFPVGAAGAWLAWRMRPWIDRVPVNPAWHPWIRDKSRQG